MGSEKIASTMGDPVLRNLSENTRFLQKTNADYSFNFHLSQTLSISHFLLKIGMKSHVIYKNYVSNTSISLH